MAQVLQSRIGTHIIIVYYAFGLQFLRNSLGEDYGKYKPHKRYRYQWIRAACACAACVVSDQDSIPTLTMNYITTSLRTLLTLIAQ